MTRNAPSRAYDSRRDGSHDHTTSGRLINATSSASLGPSDGQFNSMYSMPADNAAFDAMQRKKQLEKDISFQKEMTECMENLKRMPAFKDKVWQKVVDMHNQFEEERGQQGLLAGQ